MTDARIYEIVIADQTVDRFRTAPVEGASADEVAIGNLIDYTIVHAAGVYTLDYVEQRDGAEQHVPICQAVHGETHLLVTTDDVAADAQHAGPAIVCGTCGEQRQVCTAWECPAAFDSMAAELEKAI